MGSINLYKTQKVSKGTPTKEIPSFSLLLEAKYWKSSSEYAFQKPSEFERLPAQRLEEKRSLIDRALLFTVFFALSHNLFDYQAFYFINIHVRKERE